MFKHQLRAWWTIFGKLRIIGSFINLIKLIYKSIVCIRFEGEIWVFFFEIKNNTKMLTLTAAFHHYTGGPNSAIG